MHLKTIIVLSLALTLVLVCGCASKTILNPTKTVMLTVASKHVQYVGEHNDSGIHKEFGVTFIDANGRNIVYEESNANAIYNCVKVNHAYNVAMYNKRIMSVDGVNMN